MMDLSQQKQQFSFAYVRAVAAAAGYAVSEPSIDDDSIDLQIASRSTLGTVKRPRLELQVKCTGDAPLAEVEFSFPLKIKNYDDLRDPDVLVPRILVVLRVPNDVADWTAISDNGLIIRHCGYWISLRGRPVSDNSKSVSVRLQRENCFSSAALAAMTKRIEEGRTP